MEQMDVQKNKSGFGTAGLVLGIVGICLAFFPIINNFAFFLGIVAIIFAIVCFIKKASKGRAIAALILGILSIVITISTQNALSDALDDIGDDFNDATGKNTAELLKNSVDVTYGNFEVIVGEYGITDTKVVVKVTNKTKEVKSFSIQVEAIDKNGTRLDTDYIYANNLGAGQTQNFEAFTYVSDSILEPMKSSSFNTVEVSMN